MMLSVRGGNDISSSYPTNLKLIYSIVAVYRFPHHL
ncbi:MAG: hypothetical protein ACI8RD_010539 [Bacillariaceae sp.]|jgi:hypothetical protein